MPDPTNNYFLLSSADETKDEPYAWEAREFLRKKLIGQDVIFTSEKPPNATREYGVVWLGKGETLFFFFCFSKRKEILSIFEILQLQKTSKLPAF